jgi:hypothetical protein
VTLSNIRAMAERAQARNVTYQALAMGPQSFGGLLEARGWPSVPSPTHGEDTDFFFYPGIGPAGTLARFYGSLAGGAIDGIQVEAPYAARETAEARDSFADTLADVVIEFMGLYHDLDLVDFTAETCQVADRDTPWAFAGTRARFSPDDLGSELDTTSKREL